MGDPIDAYAIDFNVDDDAAALPVPEPDTIDPYAIDFNVADDAVQQQPVDAGFGGVTDALLGLADGALLNNGRNLGRVGQWLANKIGPDHSIGGMAPDYGGRQADIADEAYDAAEATTAGKIGRVAGNVGTSVAAGVAAPATLAGGVLTGAGLGGASGYGSSEGDPLSALVGAGVGGALGAVPGAVSAVRGKLIDANAARSAADQLRMPDALNWVQSPLKSSREALAKWLIGGADDAASYVGGVAQTPGLAAKAAPAPWATGSAAAASDAAGAATGAARKVAYAGADTSDWATTSVLRSNDTGLPPEADRELTAAKLSGDAQKMAATTFKLEQRYPEFSKRRESELRRLQEDESP